MATDKEIGQQRRTEDDIIRELDQEKVGLQLQLRQKTEHFAREVIRLKRLLVVLIIALAIVIGIAIVLFGISRTSAIPNTEYYGFGNDI